MSKCFVSCELVQGLIDSAAISFVVMALIALAFVVVAQVVKRLDL